MHVVYLNTKELAYLIRGNTTSINYMQQVETDLTDACRTLYDQCDPNDPETLHTFNVRNSLLTVRREVKERLAMFRKLQKKLKKQYRNT